VRMKETYRPLVYADCVGVSSENINTVGKGGKKRKCC
jgi:hypothetical protein